jgi:hypothetical protein
VQDKQTKADLDLDTKLMSDFIYALNIARRQIQSYPHGHPVIATAAEKLLSVLPRLLEFRTEVTIGIARDTLMVGAQSFDSKNPIYRDFATNLFDEKIASLTIDNTLGTYDICKFFEILCYKPEEKDERGGLQRILVDENIKGITVQGVDFSTFHATEVDQVNAPKIKLIEEETTVLWKSFVNGLIADTLDPEGDKLEPGLPLDPELLAEIMNRDTNNEGNHLINNYEEAITSFLKETDRNQLKSQACQETMGRLGNLVSCLKPDLRRRFLNSTLKSCTESHYVTTEFLNHLPKAQILEAMEQVDVEQLEIPQTLMDVMGKLAMKKGSESGSSRVAGKQERTVSETAVLLGQLFTADHADEFVPEDYQDALEILAASETLTGMDSNSVEELVDTLEGHDVEQQFCNVMFDLLERGTAEITIKAINRNMEEMIFYFLETGDFISLINVYNHLSLYYQQISPQLESPDNPVLFIYTSDEFIDQVLDGLDTWGKSKYPAIMELIKRVGTTFTEPLLQRLAGEPSMSKRRLFMECLQLIGCDAREPIIAHLQDQRWFFVRNLVVLLRKMNDPAVLKYMGHLVGYPDANVQFEVMRTFLHFNDPRADRYLIKKLESNDPGILINIARLAANSRNPEVSRKLSEILNRRLLKESDENIKSSVIESLAKMALPEAFPELEIFLLSRGLLQSMQGNNLKIEAVRSLLRYSDPAAAVLAEQVSRKSSGELAQVAKKIFQQLSEKLP